MRTVTAYGRVFDGKNGIRLADVRALDIAVDMKSSFFLVRKANLTYRRYARVGKLMISEEALLPLLKELADSDGMRSCFGVTHLDDTALAVFSDEKLLLLLRTAHRYINNPRTALSFSAAMFSKAAQMAVTKLRGMYDTNDRQQVFSFDVFLNKDMPLAPIMAQTVKEKFVNMLRMVQPA